LNKILRKCPTCSKEIIYDEKIKSRPFCSEKCKLIDLGEWATEKFTIVGNQNESAVDDQI
jgi:hypothetical protein